MTSYHGILDTLVIGENKSKKTKYVLILILIKVTFIEL